MTSRSFKRCAAADLSRCHPIRSESTMTSALSLYDEIGDGYAAARRTEPRIARRIWMALGDAVTVLNVGAGCGSYEPPDRDVTAVEPSAVMRAQRPPEAAPCIAAFAEDLPFPDQSFDAAMTVLSDHHWRDPIEGLLEMRRVARRVVVLQHDETWLPRFWLIRDYLPEVMQLAASGPGLAERKEAVDARMEPVPIPSDCVDGFFHAYWEATGGVPGRTRPARELRLGSCRTYGREAGRS